MAVCHCRPGPAATDQEKGRVKSILLVQLVQKVQGKHWPYLLRMLLVVANDGFANVWVSADWTAEGGVVSNFLTVLM